MPKGTKALCSMQSVQLSVEKGYPKLLKPSLKLLLLSREVQKSSFKVNMKTKVKEFTMAPNHHTLRSEMRSCWGPNMASECETKDHDLDGGDGESPTDGGDGESLVTENGHGQPEGK